MTDKQIADQVYIEPLTLESLKEIIIKKSLTASFLHSVDRQDSISAWSSLSAASLMSRE